VLPFFLLAAAAYGEAIPVGSRKQLFIDYKFIESAEGVTLRVQTPHQTREKLIVTDQSWERDAMLGSYGTVFEESGRIRLWYQLLAGTALPGENPPFMGMAYAESKDGIHFEKRVLGLVEWNGSRQNNLVMPPDPALLTVGGASILPDDNPRCPPGERYKSWSKLYPKKGSGIRGPHRVWYSPDGLRWKLYDTLVTGLRAADTQPSWFWDPRIGRYVGYSREWVRDRPDFGARMASYNESDDLFRWDSFSLALEPDERDFTALPAPILDLSRIVVKGEDVLPQRPVQAPPAPLDFYGPGVFPYEGVYIATVPVFHHWRSIGPENWPNTSDVQLAVSRDARHFTRPGRRQPFLRTGADGTFDSKRIYALPRPVRRGDELWIYYFGTNRDHAYRVDPHAQRLEAAISRAVLRLDGFVAAEADYEGGWLLTPPIIFDGARLELNLDTGAGGAARVEILEAGGKPVPGFTLAEADELNGNSVRMPASWRGRRDVSALAGKPVRLRLKMRSARLYAFQFTR